MKENSYRPEIQGLRAVASLLVAVYHIWFGRVSGGVDVFFVVSGFLITRSLLSQRSRLGAVSPLPFWGRLIRRLFPTALLVLAATCVLSMFFIGQHHWPGLLKELVASTLYLENWQLAITAVDYLDQDNAQSPVQHYWALAVQGQFYLLWPWVVRAGLALEKRLGSTEKGLRAIFAAIFVSSLAYSVVRTEADQAFTYFDTTARLWEFSLGALLTVLPPFRMGTIGQVILSWLGIFLIVSCGALLGVATEFPGYIALWPSGAGALILLAGTSPATRFSGTRLLGSRVFSGFGDISYAFYLWHWPLLTILKSHLGVDRLDLGWGLGLMAVSAGLAYVTTHSIEIPARRTHVATHQPFRFGAYCMLPNGAVIAVLAAWIAVERGASSDPVAYRGAQAVPLGKDVWSKHDKPIKPGPLEVKADRPALYKDDCHQKLEEADVLSCVYGDQRASKTIALVGGSHSAHWLPALRELAEKRSFRVVTYTKGSCRLGLGEASSPNDSNEKINKRVETCRKWVSSVLDELSRTKPDYVFTTATTGRRAKDSVPSSFLRAWRHLEESGVNVLAIRDNPWFEFDVPECVVKSKQQPEKCSRLRADLLSNDSPLLSDKLQRPNVIYLDLSEYFCPDDTCPAVIGNVLVYRDAHHLTTLYSKTLAPALEEQFERYGVKL